METNPLSSSAFWRARFFSSLVYEALASSYAALVEAIFCGTRADCVCFNEACAESRELCACLMASDVSRGCTLACLSA